MCGIAGELQLVPGEQPSPERVRAMATRVGGALRGVGWGLLAGAIWFLLEIAGNWAAGGVAPQPMGKGSLMFLLPTGGEPFLRKDIGEIVKIFHKNTGVRNVGIPTNGSTTARTVSIVKDLCESCPELDLHIDVSLDGVGELHDEIRVFPGLFKRSIETYKALRDIEKHYKNFSVQVETTVSKHNDDVLIENYEWFRQNLDVDTVFTLLTRGSPKEPLAKFFDVEKYQAYADHMG